MALEDPSLEEPGLSTGQEPVLLAQASPGLAMPQAPVAPQAPAPAAPVQQGLSAVAPSPQKKNDPVANMMNFFRDPKRLGAAAAAAAAAEDPQTIQWLKRGYEAQKENAGEALAKLVAGDTQGAIETFNMNGTMVAKSIEPGSKKGLYKITMQDGNSREIDPQKELMSLLTPPQMLQHMRNEEANAIRLELGKGLIDARNAATTARSESDAAKAAQRQSEFEARAAEREARIARDYGAAAASNARADRLAATPAGPAGPKPLNTQQATAIIGRESEKVFATPDEITGKSKPGDPKDVIKIKVMAKKLWEEDPTIDPADAVQRAKDIYDQAVERANAKVEQEVAGAKKAVEVKATSPSTWGNLFTGPDFKGKKPDDYRKARVKEEVDKELKGATSTATKAAAKAMPAVNAKGWKLHTDKNGNKAYVSPDGKSYEEAQ